MTYTDKIKQAEYNKKYHDSKKLEIKEIQTMKEVCKFCGRKVQHCNMFKHLKSDYCLNHRKFLKIFDDNKPDNLFENIIKNRPTNDTGTYSEDFLEKVGLIVQGL